MDDGIQEPLHAGALDRIELRWAIDDLQQEMLLYVSQIDMLRNRSRCQLRRCGFDVIDEIVR